MVQRLRNIFSLIFIIGFFGLTVSFATNGLSFCSSVSACLSASLYSLNLNFDTHQSKPSVMPDSPIATISADSGGLVSQSVALLSLNLILMSLVALIVLEMIEVHYLKSVLRHRKKAAW